MPALSKRQKRICNRNDNGEYYSKKAIEEQTIKLITTKQEIFIITNDLRTEIKKKREYQKI